MRFRKKPVEIEAIQWNGKNRDEIHEFITSFSSNIGAEGILIKTLEGDMTADKDDWIIKGVKGEFYPCKPDIFDLTYEPVICDEEIIISLDVLHCPGCGKPKILCLKDTTGCME